LFCVLVLCVFFVGVCVFFVVCLECFGCLWGVCVCGVCVCVVCVCVYVCVCVCVCCKE